ncbi:hypothetical protein NHX12_023983 [Muraenolepis orangiensis]|uniref:Uncharacterized protein n=1 Tax=Muraenolepis orangiensis TaxID=630683 RepID=A0A9Q0IQM0_9TELE|nr:hypothetical protein NHX12_023983 [Muraenolepis orangiensis]
MFPRRNRNAEVTNSWPVNVLQTSRQPEWTGNPTGTMSRPSPFWSRTCSLRVQTQRMDIGHRATKALVFGPSLEDMEWVAWRTVMQL